MLLIDHHFDLCVCMCVFQDLLKFTLPLCLVYFAEYFINQGLVSSKADVAAALV